MAKNTFLDWDTTASNNTDVAGTGIQGSNAVQNFDDALRSCMAQLRSGVDGKMTYVNKTANYTALANDNNAFFDISATSVTISLTAAATLAVNWHCWIWANGYDVIIDPNASELINGAATLTVKNGALALVTCTGTAFKAATIDLSTKLDVAQPLFTIASATTTDLSTVTSIEGTITGTTTITGLGTAAAGTMRSVYFAAALTLTHNATSLILPTGANITTAAGDSATFISLGSGNWRCLRYAPFSNMTQPFLLLTSVATTSGTTADQLNIPASAKRITIMFSGVSTSGTSLKQIQLGTSGGIQTTGYDSLWSFVQAGGAANSAVATTGFALPSNLAADTIKGAIVLTLQNASTGIWTAYGVLQQTAGAVYQMMVSGEKTLSGTLDRIRLTTVNGTDTFDAGSITVMVE